MKTLTKLFVAVAILFGSVVGSAQAGLLDSPEVYDKAKAVYMAMENMTPADLEEDGVDFGLPKELPGVKNPINPSVKLKVADFEVFNPSFKTYARVRVLVDPATGVVQGAEYLYLGK